MAQEIADSKLLDTWSSSGTKIEPDISKIIEGWQLGEQPPHEYMNWLQNTFGSKLNHILKNGVASWNNTTQYLAGSSVQYNGNVWLCKTTNTNSEPTDLNANWERLAINKDLTVTVDTLADLRSISYPANTVWASGYHTKNDGAFGSHIFRLKGVKTTETDDGGTVIITTIGGTDYVYELQYDGAANVKWFGAKGDGVTDDTVSFNRATNGDYQSLGNNDNFIKANVYIPTGTYVLSGTVYVHKGQCLSGDGEGATYINVPVRSTGKPTFKMGYSSVGEDAGGLPPVIENIFTIGGDTTGAVVDSIVAGSKIRNLFMTSCGVGIGAGSDCIISNCIIDQGLNGINLSGQNVIIDSCLFYNMNYGIMVLSSTYDVQINNCHFEYGIYADICFSDGATDIQNVSISNCQFLQNEQYSKKLAMVYFRSNYANTTITGCNFRNMKGFAIARGNGVNNSAIITNCVFDGLKTNTAYTQSTTAKAIDSTYSKFLVSSCIFKNLSASPIVNGTSGYLKLIDSSYSNIEGDSLVGNATGETHLYNNKGDKITPLTVLGNIYTKGNIDWLGAAITENSRLAYKIPIKEIGVSYILNVSANSNPGGNQSYSMSSTFVLSTTCEYSGSAYANKVHFLALYEAPTSYVPKLDIEVDANTVGNGVWSAEIEPIYAVISVPTSYSNFNIKIID